MSFSSYISLILNEFISAGLDVRNMRISGESSELGSALMAVPII
jgi:hypothetical protein